jgi:hypothetical protein
MRTEHPIVDLKAEHAKFVDYWHAKSGKDATKNDWNATWRNWIRRAAERPGVNSSNVTAFERKKAANAAVFASLADPTSPTLEIER